MGVDFRRLLVVFLQHYFVYIATDVYFLDNISPPPKKKPPTITHRRNGRLRRVAESLAFLNQSKREPA
jgi:hypothetical protein